MMYIANIKDAAKENNNFRKVLSTQSHSQLVVMSLLPQEDIGEEVHETSDQILYIVRGAGEANIAGESHEIGKGSIIVIPSGTRHNIKNTSEEAMKLFTIYAPAVHKDGTVHANKKDAAEEWE